jgi:hypothetical protein
VAFRLVGFRPQIGHPQFVGFHLAGAIQSDVKLWSCGLLEVGCPIRIPLTVCTVQA